MLRKNRLMMGSVVAIRENGPVSTAACAVKWQGTYLLLLGLLCFGGNRSLAAEDSQHTRGPNVIVILADDLGFSDLGCYGGEIPTPNIDRLANHGSRFSSFYTSARCCPSRASLNTGLHPHQAGIGSFARQRPRKGWGPAYTGHLLPTCVTTAEVLKAAGYSTWMVGKWHMSEPGPIQRGFEHFYGYVHGYEQDQWEPERYVRLPKSESKEIDYEKGDFYATDVFNEYALEFLQQARQDERPYFLYLAHSSPHFPVQAPSETVNKYYQTYLRGWDILRAERLSKQKALGLFDSSMELPPRSMVPVDRDDVTNGFSGQPNPAWDNLPEERQADLARRMATFAAMVDHVDRGVGQILSDLKAHGELDNTLIFFMSDNGACYEWGPFGFDGPSRQGITKLHTGEELASMGQAGSYHAYGSGWANLGNTPLSMYKHFCHEGGIASPLIVHWPAGLPEANAWVHEPAHLIDVLPTIIEATGAKHLQRRDGFRTTPLEGKSLLGPIAGKPLQERPIPFEHQAARGLRRGKWKITWGKRQPEDPSWELYNLEEDRAEQQNLADRYPDLVKQLAGEWEAWAKRVGAEPFQQPEDPRLSNYGVISRADNSRQTPIIKGRSINILTQVRAENPQGVVLAQGGREQGYAIHFIDGKVAFDVRRDGEVTRLLSNQTFHGNLRIEANLDAQQMTVSVNGQAVASTTSPGLIDAQPTDPLTVGLDSRTAAGDYAAPNPFSGKILSTSVRTQ